MASNVNTLPIILYDLEGKTFKSHNITTHSPCIYFYSYQNFDISIIEGTGDLYSVIQKTTESGDNYLSSNKGQEFTGFINFGYTLYIPEDKTSVTVKVSNKLGFIDYYKFTLILDNIITEANEHYNDLIINNYLPTLEELEPAIMEGTSKRDLLKRMLLDFRDIMRAKGTKKSIEKFFYFVGFLKEQIKVLEEYRKYNPDSQYNSKYEEYTTTPNTKLDTKTGNYHVVYDNWDDKVDDGKQQLNDKNLPYRPFDQQNFELFFETLKHAIALANKYFTLVEQEITFFGINFSSNIPMFPSITSMFNQIFYHDIQSFRKFIHIDLYYKEVSQKGNDSNYYLVKNCVQKEREAYRTEVKFVLDGEILNNGELYWVEREIADNEEYNDNLPEYKRAFGALLRLKVKSPKTYVTITIYNTANELISIKYPKTWCEDELEVFFVTEQVDLYKVIIDVYDAYNNYERYIYEYIISNNVNLIDFELFNTLMLVDKNLEDNDINLDVDSGTLTSTFEGFNYIVPEEYLPEDLSKYFQTYTGTDIIRWLTNASTDKFDEHNPQYKLPSINKNFKLTEVTETIPVELTEQWLTFAGIPYNNEQLKIRIYNVEKDIYEILDIKEGLSKYDPTFDKLFIRYIDIIEQSESDDTKDEITDETVDEDINESTGNKVIKKYLFISPTETGIELNKNTFDLYLDDTSIYDLENCLIRKSPVNYDFPLFPTEGDELVYLSENTYQQEINGKLYPIVKSMFPRFINIESPELTQRFDVLCLGDVFLARLNQNYVVNEMNVKWEILNAVTNRIIFQTTDYMLKYRIDDNMIYTITCSFELNGVLQTITKTGIFSSFKHIIYE